MQAAAQVTQEQLQDAYSFLKLRVTFDYAISCPALLTCLKNVAYIRAKRLKPHKAYSDWKTRAANPNEN